MKRLAVFCGSATPEDPRYVARRVVRMKTFHEVRDYLTEKTQRICPSAAILDLQE